MILLLDNYDSFTFNLVQYLGEMNPDLRVVRNDALTVEEALALKPSHIVISPGPCTPVEAGISIPLIKACPKDIPLLGVCLGHQSLGAAFGGQVIRAPQPIHGKTAVITCNQRDLFANLPKTFTATRYHSLIVERSSLPSELESLTGFFREPRIGVYWVCYHRRKSLLRVEPTVTKWTL